MAKGRIKGITIELGADVSEFSEGLKKIDSDLSKSESKLKDVNKLLKLDPTNTELLTQKQKTLTKAIEDTAAREEYLQKAIAKASDPKYVEELNKKLEETKKKLEAATDDKTIKKLKGEIKQTEDAIESASNPETVEALKRELIETTEKMKGLKEQTHLFGEEASAKFTEAGKKLQAAGGQIEDAGKKITTVAVAVGGALIKAGVDAAGTADDLNALSQQSGLTTETLQGLYAAADLIDVRVEDITSATQKMTKTMATSPKYFDELGVAIQNTDGTMRGVEDVFWDVIEALSQIPDETKKDQIAMNIFGKGANALAGIVDDNGEAFREFTEELKENGLIMSQDELNAANALNDELDKMKAKTKLAFSKVGVKIAEKLVPLMEKAVPIIDKLIDKILNMSDGTKKTLKVIGTVIAILGPVLIIAGKIISLIGTISVAAGALNVAMLPMIGTVAAIIAIVTAVIAAGVLLAKNWDKIKAKAIELWNNLGQTWENIKNTIATKVENLKTSISDKLTNIKTTASNIWDNIKTTAANKWDALKTTITDKVEALKTKVKDLWEGIKSFFTEGINIPHIKLPHFTVQGSLNPLNWYDQGLPKIGVEWYKKAMSQPYTFDSPTIIGVGEAGSETVLGTDLLNRLLANNRQNSASSIVVNVNANVASNIDINRLATTISTKIQQQVNQKVAAAR